MRDRGLTGNHNTVFSQDDSSDSGISTGLATPPNGTNDSENLKKLYVLSSRDSAGNERWAKILSAKFADSELDKEDPEFLDNLAYTLANRRSHHGFRTFAIASSLDDLSKQLSSQLIPKFKRASVQAQNIVFVCTGQGAQWPAMGVELLKQPVFRQSVQTSQEFLKIHGCKWSPLEELLKTTGSNINIPEYSQTLCTVLQIALIDLLRHWNIIPKATVGHSSGEIGNALLLHANP